MPARKTQPRKPPPDAPPRLPPDLRDRAEACARLAAPDRHAAGIDVSDATHWACVEVTPDGADPRVERITHNLLRRWTGAQNGRMANAIDQKPADGWRRRLYEVVFEADTPAGRAFDLALIWAIVASVIVVVVESVAAIRARHGELLRAAEWAFTLVFTVEYVARLACVRRPARYAVSFLGVIDLLAVVPTYLSLLVPGTQALVVVRVLRVLRIFRVLKLTAYLRESRVLVDALWAGRRKIGVFLFAVLTLLVVIGSLMYLVEGEANGFVDIPTSVYWAVVTLTTVGYGDIAPKTALGRTLSAAVMILGYCIIAVPTGIVTAELSRSGRRADRLRCAGCGAGDHDADARHCKHCGAALAGPPAG